MNGRPRNLLYNIQFLRAYAAFAVVYFHCSAASGLVLPISFGSYGVDIFFVISGFIISYIVSIDPANFFLRRIIRIVPFYWTSTIAIFLLKYAAPSFFRHMPGDLTTLLTSLFFVPYPQPDGNVHPLVSLGWTLNYEMYFYALFAIGLQISKKNSSLICAGLVCAVMAAVQLLHPASPTIAYYGNPTVLEFVAGIAVFHIYRYSAPFAASWARKPHARVALLIAVGLAILALPVEQGLGYWYPHALIWGIPAFITVAGMLFLERDFGIRIESPFILLLGEASYVLYLIHPYLIFGMIRAIVPRAPHWALGPKLALALALMSVAGAIAVAIHLYFEKPVMDFLKRRLLPH